MQLEDLLKGLSYGVLSNLALGNEGSGEIPNQHEPKVVHHVNRALLALYSKFQIKTNEVQVRAYDNLTLYPLKKIYADQDPTVVAQKFITDSVESPFEEDVIRVTAIYDEEGTPLLFDTDDPLCKLFLPQPTTLQIVEPVTGNDYFLIYQAKHKTLVAGDGSQEVELPEVLYPALEAHVAYQVYSSMNGQENAAKATEHFSAYTMLTEQVIELDLVGTSTMERNTKLEDRGFK